MASKSDDGRGGGGGGAREEVKVVPMSLLVLTAIVCMGVMINVTVVIPTATLYGESLLDAALVISAYSLGAIPGLFLFYAIGRQSLRTAYLLHCFFMCVGNAGMLASHSVGGDGAILTWALLSRVVIGLEGAVMYNAAVALVEYSSPHLRVKYLAMYQFFVGLGLILGPAFAAVSILVAEALVLQDTHSFVFLALTVWGALLACAVLTLLPDNNALAAKSVQHAPPPTENTALLASSPLPREPPPPAELPFLVTEGGEGTRAALLCYMCAGNLARISLRILLEAGLIVVLIRSFGFSVVSAGLTMAAFGVAQTAAQYAYSLAGPPSLHALPWLELVQLSASLVMLACGLSADRLPAGAPLALFLGTAAIGYLSNCLSSAPFNDVLLRAADRCSTSREELLLSSQLGIFLGFVVGPIAVLVTMMFAAAEPPALAAVLLCGWGVQALVTAGVTAGRSSVGLAALVGLLAASLLAWATLDPTLGGTGPYNLFSWHPVAMAAAFPAFMTWGVQAYAPAGPQTGGVPALAELGGVGGGKEERRNVHVTLMASAVVLAALGYAAIFAAHARIGESQIGLGTTWGRAVHVWVGYLALAWAAVQASAGVLKILPLGEKPEWLERALKLHGASGKYLVRYALLVVMLGVWLKMNFDGDGWGVPLKLALSALLAALLLLLSLPQRPPEVPAPHKDPEQ